MIVWTSSGLYRRRNNTTAPIARNSDENCSRRGKTIFFPKHEFFSVLIWNEAGCCWAELQKNTLSCRVQVPRRPFIFAIRGSPTPLRLLSPKKSAEVPLKNSPSPLSDEPGCCCRLHRPLIFVTNFSVLVSKNSRNLFRPTHSNTRSRSRSHALDHRSGAKSRILLLLRGFRVCKRRNTKEGPIQSSVRQRLQIEETQENQKICSIDSHLDQFKSSQGRPESGKSPFPSR